MMDQAAAWRAIAGSVADAGARGAAAVEGVHFEGPAAERTRAAARSQRARAAGIAADLRALAAALMRDAEELAVEQRRERERQAEAAREAAAAAEAQARGGRVTPAGLRGAAPMTRIAIEPAGLRRAAGVLRDVATEQRRSASRLAGDGLPSMPPELVARYAGRVRGLAEALDALAGDLVRSGASLDTRARLADAAGQGGTVTTRVAPIPAPGVLSGRVPRIPTRERADGRRLGRAADARARRRWRLPRDARAPAPPSRTSPAGWPRRAARRARRRSCW